MSHSSEKTWLFLSEGVSNINKELLHLTVRNKEEYERIKEVYTFCNSDDIQFANLLFKNDKDLVTASALEITMATELWDSVKMWDEMNDFMNNVVVTAKNRAKKLRNVS